MCDRIDIVADRIMPPWWPGYAAWRRRVFGAAEAPAGPWMFGDQILPGSRSYRIVSLEDEETVAWVPARVWSDEAQRAQLDAAMLISMAPELLAALQQLLYHLSAGSSAELVREAELAGYAAIDQALGFAGQGVGAREYAEYGVRGDEAPGDQGDRDFAGAGELPGVCRTDDRSDCGASGGGVASDRADVEAVRGID